MKKSELEKKLDKALTAYKKARGTYYKEGCCSDIYYRMLAFYNKGGK